MTFISTIRHQSVYLKCIQIWFILNSIIFFHIYLIRDTTAYRNDKYFTTNNKILVCVYLLFLYHIYTIDFNIQIHIHIFTINHSLICFISWRKYVIRNIHCLNLRKPSVQWSCTSHAISLLQQTYMNHFKNIFFIIQHPLSIIIILSLLIKQCRLNLATRFDSCAERPRRRRLQVTFDYLSNSLQTPLMI